MDPLALRPLLVRFLLGRVGSPEAAEDLAQEVLLRAATHADQLRAKENPAGWLFQIARNVAADFFRRSRPVEQFHEEHHGAQSETDPVVDEEEESLRNELHAYVRSEIEKLPPAYRDALIATEIEGIPQVEIARRLGLSASAAKSRVQRGRRLLKANMERCCRFEADKYGKILDVEPKSPATCRCDRSRPG